MYSRSASHSWPSPLPHCASYLSCRSASLLPFCAVVRAPLHSENDVGPHCILVVLVVPLDVVLVVPLDVVLVVPLPLPLPMEGGGGGHLPRFLRDFGGMNEER